MNDRLIHLRIKIKSLAAEAMIIRQEASKVHGLTKYGLNHHRTSVVRWHTRHNLLAYGFLRGRTYEEMEKKCEDAPNFDKVVEIAKRFGATSEVDLAIWVEKAKAYIKSTKQ